MIRSLRQRADSENFLRRARMDVFAIAKRFHKHGILRKMCHHAQLDLRIICGKQNFSFFRDKRGANLPAQFRSNGNVLQIGVA